MKAGVVRVIVVVVAAGRTRRADRKLVRVKMADVRFRNDIKGVLNRILVDV
jgi:hypothetical protein